MFVSGTGAHTCSYCCYCPCLRAALSQDGKTKSLVSALEQVGAPADKKTLLVLGAADETVTRAGRNVAKLAINTADAIKVCGEGEASGHRQHSSGSLGKWWIGCSCVGAARPLAWALCCHVCAALCAVVGFVKTPTCRLGLIIPSMS